MKSIIIIILSKILKFLEKLVVVVLVLLHAILTFLNFLFEKALYIFFILITFNKTVEDYFNSMIFFFFYLYKKLRNVPYNIYRRLWKRFIDFLFFKVYRNRKPILKNFRFFIKYTLILISLNYILSIGFLNYIHSYIFSNNLESFGLLNFDNYSNIVNVFFSLLNIDYFILLIYIIFFKVGVFNVIFSNFNENLIVAGLNWSELFYTYKATNNDFLFFNFLKDNLYSYLSSFSVNFLIDIDVENTPIFFFFGVLFFSTVILSWLFFSYLGLYGIFQLNLITLFLFWVSLLFSAKSIFIQQKVFVIKLCSWVFLSLNVKIDYYFLIDTISFSFMLLTTTIAFFVFIYAFSYFRYEPLVDRFLLFLLSFVVSMLFLVSSGNTIMLFLGWELIGLTSFCLINFWTTKAATLKSAFKAFTFNKISDFYMFMFLVSSYSVYYTFDILSLNTQVYKYESLLIYVFGTPINFLEFLSIMLIGAAFIKSAQFGGHVWLPDSMEAPVPASSLIHSATLVSAGVYLILRFNFIFDATQFSKFLIPIIGSLTAAYGGVCAVAQSDIKKTLAYSTISHCGFLMVLCSTEMNEFTILYLYVHGFFKAGVFMCVGNVLRITKGYQDTRRMGGLIKFLPFEYFCATIGVMNLAGLPFTFGFFIKHLLLLSLDTHFYIYIFVIFNCLVGAFSGLFYSFRLINYTFCDFKKGNKSLYLTLNKINYNSSFYTNSSLAGTFSIFFLFIFSYLITYFLVKYFISGNYLFSDYMNTTILSNYYSIISSYNGYLLNFSFVNLTVTSIALAFFFSKYRKVQRIHNIFKCLFTVIVWVLFLFIFYNFL